MDDKPLPESLHGQLNRLVNTAWTVRGYNRYEAMLFAPVQTGRGLAHPVFCTYSGYRGLFFGG
jgi:hypothetical protein